MNTTAIQCKEGLLLCSVWLAWDSAQINVYLSAHLLRSWCGQGEGCHDSLSVTFMMKMMIWHFVSNIHKVMTDHSHCQIDFKVFALEYSLKSHTYPLEQAVALPYPCTCRPSAEGLKGLNFNWLVQFWTWPDRLHILWLIVFLCQRFRVKIPVYFSSLPWSTILGILNLILWWIHLSEVIWDPSFCSVADHSILYSPVPLDGLVQTMPDSSWMQHGIFLWSFLIVS